ncbi:MAG TPA: haloacid dehalogenase type II [Candidatus Acidoferrales bacterium]|jgi:2-haloacid dehalogenase|nr:haloacid dehalogenase type II [Candidatus Acidoferrales bacterium]
MPNGRQAEVLAFDVYGTLIDPFHMEEHLRQSFGGKAKEASELLRSKQLEYSFRRGLMNKYVPFDVCTAQALRFTCAQLGVSISEAAHSELMAKYLELPAYPDAEGALATAVAHGFQIAACSNGTENAVRRVLDHAGILSHFGKIVSVDPIRTFKPDPAVYEYLVEELHARRDLVWLVSSNPFDVIGAKACGLRTAWVQRDPKRIFDSWEFEPDVTIRSLTELPQKVTSRA